MAGKTKNFMKLDRPIAFFDIEATGKNVRADRIVELAVTKILPDGKRETSVIRLNPGIPIPKEASDIHGIKDEDVANCPKFIEKAREIEHLFEGCDLAGYNILRFDIPMLEEEFQRAKMNVDFSDRRVLDAQKIFHKREPRDLSAALAFYCNEMHLNAHGAEADVVATIRVVEGQFAKYKDLPADMTAMDEYCNLKEPDWVDKDGRLKWDNGEVVLNFGKRKGDKLRDIIQNETSFVKWILNSDFPRDTKRIIRDAVDGKWPTPPAVTEK